MDLRDLKLILKIVTLHKAFINKRAVVSPPYMLPAITQTFLIITEKSHSVIYGKNNFQGE